MIRSCEIVRDALNVAAASVAKSSALSSRGSRPSAARAARARQAADERRGDCRVRRVRGALFCHDSPFFRATRGPHTSLDELRDVVEVGHRVAERAPQRHPVRDQAEEDGDRLDPDVVAVALSAQPLEPVGLLAHQLVLGLRDRLERLVGPGTGAPPRAARRASRGPRA